MPSFGGFWNWLGWVVIIGIVAFALVLIVETAWYNFCMMLIRICGPKEEK